MRRRSFLCMLTATSALAACASWTAPPPLLLRLAPATLGRHLALVQLIRVQARGAQFQFEALLEADDASLRLAVLAYGRPMVRLVWDGQVLTQDAAPEWPAAVSAERMLSDLTLALWPADVLAAALPASSACGMTPTSVNCVGTALRCSACGRSGPPSSNSSTLHCAITCGSSRRRRRRRRGALRLAWREFQMGKPFVLLAAAGLLAACASTYNQNMVTPAAAKLQRGKAVLIATPRSAETTRTTRTSPRGVRPRTQ